MRAMAIERFGEPETLELTDISRPVPSRGEILVRVVAAGVNPIDRLICKGRFAETVPHAFPLIPGFELAGVVEELGEGATRFRKGDRVWAMVRHKTIQSGCYADYVAVPEALVAMMPAKLLFEEAAALALVGLAAHEALFSGGTLDRDSAVLVHGACDGLGHVAVQMARHAGARVLASSDAEDQGFLVGLGAIALDAASDGLESEVLRHCPDGLDVAIDSLGDTAPLGGSLFREGGRCVRVDDDLLFGATDADAAQARLVVEPSAERLEQIGRIADARGVRPHLQKIYPLTAAAEAHRVLEQGRVRGRLVLNL